MASEPSEEEAASLTLPAELNDWLDGKAADLDVDREVLVVQLLASYRAAEQLDDGARTPADLLDGDIEGAVRDVIAERIPDIARAVEDNLDGQGEELAAVESRIGDEIDRLDRELADVESSFRSKLDDVRERVIQVKKEADAKAPDEHSHSELDDVPTLRAQLEGVESAMDDLDAAIEDHDGAIGDLETDLDGVESRLDDIEEKLDTIAWVVSDLREAHEAQRGGTRAIDRLKRTAARKDVDRAVCDNCENPVDIALLSEPTCPHCESTVSDVRLPDGFFGKPRLSVAKQLESGDDSPDDGEGSNVPDAARR